MTATEREARARKPQPPEPARARRESTRDPGTGAAPIVVAVDPQTAHVTADSAARLARELGAALVFVTVRPRLPADVGNPHHQRDSHHDGDRAHLVYMLDHVDTSSRPESRIGA